jgi:hypothetical protein
MFGKKENQMKPPLVLLSVTHFASCLDKPFFSSHLPLKQAPTRFAFQKGRGFVFLDHLEQRTKMGVNL